MWNKASTKITMILIVKLAVKSHIYRRRKQSNSDG